VAYAQTDSLFDNIDVASQRQQAERMEALRRLTPVLEDVPATPDLGVVVDMEEMSELLLPSLFARPSRSYASRRHITRL